MWNGSYNIIMQTTIGARYGTITVFINHSKVNGMLDILKKANPFHGKINEKGDCQIKGELTTLMRTIPYNATGRLTKDTLVLNLKGERESFKIFGTASTPFLIMEKEQTITI